MLILGHPIAEQREPSKRYLAETPYILGAALPVVVRICGCQLCVPFLYEDNCL